MKPSQVKTRPGHQRRQPLGQLALWVGIAMAGFLAVFATRLLDSDDDIEFQRRVLKAVGDAALEEHAEWLLMQRERPLEHGGI